VTVTSDVPNRKVTVTVRSTQSTYFARALGLKTAEISATATAEAAQFAEGAGCVKPWFLPNTVLSTSDACDAGCGAAETLINPTTREVTAFAYSKIGTQFSVKPQDPSGALSPGNFYAINFPGANGADDYRDAIGYCKSPYLRCGDYQEPKTGNMVGPTKQGVEALIGDPPRFTWIGPGQYRKVSDNKTYDISENVILTPIWNVCGSQYCASGKQKNDVPIIGFATVFIEGVNKDDVIGRLLGVASCGAVLGGPTGGTTLSLPLRLVR
jgi:hypothetical protein